MTTTHSMHVSFGGKTCSFKLFRPGMPALTGPLVALDTETTLVKVGSVPDYVIGVACDGTAGYLITRSSVPSFLKLHHDKTFVMHNAAFDVPVLEKAGGDLTSWVEHQKLFDTGLYHRLLELAENGQANIPWGLDHLVNKYSIGTVSKTVQDSAGNDVRTSYEKFLRPDGQPDNKVMLLPENRVYLKYACLDGLATWLLAQAIGKRAAELFNLPNLNIFCHSTFPANYIMGGVDLGTAWHTHGFLSHHIQLIASLALASIERRGMGMDTSHTQSIVNRLVKEQKQALKELSSHGWQPGTDSQTNLQNFLSREEKRLHVSLPRTPTGRISAAASALEEIQSRSLFVDLYLNYQRLTKLIETFLAPIQQRIRVYGRFNVIVNTGRTSCSAKKAENGAKLGLNLQNLPRDSGVRECFVPSPEYLLLAVDYCGIEMVTLAQVCLNRYGSSRMAQLINQGADLHSIFAAHRCGVDISQYTDLTKASLRKAIEATGKNPDAERQAAKAVNFGVPGGLGAQALVQYAKQTYGVDMTIEKARGEIERWIDFYPEMRSYRQSDDFARFVRRYRQLVLSHPNCSPSGLMYEDTPWPFWNLRGVLIGQKCTNAGKVYTHDEVEWAWLTALQIGALGNGNIPPAVIEAIQTRQASKELFNALLPPPDPVVTLTGRLREGVNYCSARNTPFQGLAADGAKIALYGLECAGFRVVNFIHDEVLVEIPKKSDHLALAEQVKQIMIGAMQIVVPNVRIDCEYALMRRWYKGAKAVIENGRLLPWNPAGVTKLPINGEVTIPSGKQNKVQAQPWN